MAKVFESLFGSVTCLPGWCRQTLHISNQLITDYSENRVDTLYRKNILHPGEDRLPNDIFFWNIFHFSRLSLSEMHLRSPWHRMIGRFCYPSVDVGLALRFTTWADLFSWSSYDFCCLLMRFILLWLIYCLQLFNPFQSAMYVFFVTLPHVLRILFSCRLYIWCISSSDKVNLSLLCHWSWLRQFMVFKFGLCRLETEVGYD